MSSFSNWNTLSESKYPWERDALDFVRERLPSHEPYRAWSNFEFIADDGSINEVDLLVFSPYGFFLIEIKSRPGQLVGDAGTWTWKTDDKLRTVDNPLIATNMKAKKLSSLLQRQRASKKKHRLPFLEALVFCSAPGLKCDLTGNARFRVCLRDKEASSGREARPGIMAAITHRDCPGLDASPRGQHDRPMAKVVTQALDQAGIRPSQRHRKVADCVLDHLILEGPGYQDWEATHAQISGAKRRVRLYLVRTQENADDRKTIERAAHREAQLLETLQHPGILRVLNYKEHELGPALVFEHDPSFIRLDHFLAQRNGQLSIDVRLAIVRQIAEVVRFAHDKRVVHRALSPQSILIHDSVTEPPRIQILNWMSGYRAGSASSLDTYHVTATSHIDRLVEDASTAYMAPETFSDKDNVGEHLDVFSLGAIAYHVLSGQPPAANGLELSETLRSTKGLQISSVLNGAGQSLQDLIQYSTHPEVPSRLDSATDFLEYLEEAEDELTAPEHDLVEDPSQAQKGDMLPGGLTVLRRLGQGACSVALLVQRENDEFVLKTAVDAEFNVRLTDEAEVLQKVHHQHIVKYSETVEIGDRVCILMRRAGTETLGQRLRREGRLHVDLLQRFGDDLLAVVSYLEEQGIPHRDIKPDNIGVGPVGRGDKLHLVLFDFSLSRTSAESIRAGTPGYLDPLLPVRIPPRWDLHAERYAAAATLYELAAGPNNLPIWGDGQSDPSHLDCEATIDSELFDTNLREALTAFFRKAFRRTPTERFDNGEEMLRAWRQCFEGIDEPGQLIGQGDEAHLRELLSEATFETQVAELELGTRASNAFDRANIITVKDLLLTPVTQLTHLRGVGHKTRKEVALVVKILLKRLGRPETTDVVSLTTHSEADLTDVANYSVDLLAPLITGTRSKLGTAGEPEILRALLTLDASLDLPWPSQSDVARHLEMTPVTVHEILKKAQQRWKREPAVTRLRDDVVEIIRANGGVCSVEELREAVLVARGCVQDEPLRSRLAMAVIRAIVEVERTMTDPRLLVRRDRECVLIALNQEMAGYACSLGREADKLADEDPLTSPARGIERLRAVGPQGLGDELSDGRLVRLAAAASKHAALSSRQELYPHDMDAARALKLSYGAILGVPYLSGEQIQERVRSRYSEAAQLPARPRLDALLIEAGFELKWNASANQGRGCYVSQMRDTRSMTTGSGPVSRYPTLGEADEPPPITPEIADARQFEERLQRAANDGAFLALLVNPRYYQQACDELRRRFPVELIDFEGIFIDALREEAEKANVNWDLILKTDATPGGDGWDNLIQLVKRIMPRIEQQLSSPDRTMLVIYPSMLARYDQMGLLQRLRDMVGRRDGIHGLWLLIAGDQQAMMNGRAVPIISPGQRARIPESWLKNAHRANGYDAAVSMSHDTGGT